MVPADNVGAPSKPVESEKSFDSSFSSVHERRVILCDWSHKAFCPHLTQPRLLLWWQPEFWRALTIFSQFWRKWLPPWGPETDGLPHTPNGASPHSISIWLQLVDTYCTAPRLNCILLVCCQTLKPCCWELSVLGNGLYYFANRGTGKLELLNELPDLTLVSNWCTCTHQGGHVELFAVSSVNRLGRCPAPAGTFSGT